MNSIDFLPERFREEFAQKKSQFWRIVASVLVGMVLILASVMQWNTKRNLAATLEEITPIHDAAHGRTVQLTSLNKELAKLSDRANLLIYLSHPWPRTQILAAIVEPLPESIKLGELTMTRIQEEGTNVVLPSQRARNAQQGGSGAKPGEGTQTEPESSDRIDLKQLQTEFNAHSTIVQIVGETKNVSELHMYLAEIAQHQLIVKAELRSIESGRRDSQLTTFRARIFIKPGYGQPDGPTLNEVSALETKVPKTAWQKPLRAIAQGGKK